MSIARILVSLSLVPAGSLVFAQAVPSTSYTITQANAGGAAGATTTVYRSGSKVLMEMAQSAQNGSPATRSLTLYDLNTGTSWSWDPAASSPECSSGKFSGDWGDPFAMTAELNAGIAKGDLKPAGTETVAGVPTEIYAGSSGQTSIKAWLDGKDGLVMRAQMSGPGSPAVTLVDIRKVSFAAPSPSLFALPAACAGVKPPPSEADVIAEETGDDGANYVNGMYGPGSSNSCSVVLRVVNAKTMTPIPHIQVAIDTTYDVDHPPHYDFGMHNDGSQTFSGGGIREITSQVRNGRVSLGTPPAAFMLGVNLIQPGRGAGMGLVYRQCFAPTTVLLYVVKDYGQASQSGDFLWVKGGKYGVPPAN